MRAECGPECGQGSTYSPPVAQGGLRGVCRENKFLGLCNEQQEKGHMFQRQYLGGCGGALGLGSDSGLFHQDPSLHGHTQHPHPHRWSGQPGTAQTGLSCAMQQCTNLHTDVL